MDGIRRITGTLAPTRHSESAAPHVAPKVAKAVDGFDAVRSTRAAETYPPLGPTRLASDPETPLVLTGCAPNHPYVVTMARPHPEDPANMTLLGTVSVTSDAKGRIDLGLNALRQILKREPSAEELRFGGTVALKLMGEKPRYALAPNEAKLVSAMGDGDRVTITAQPAASAAKAPPVVTASQDFVEAPSNVVRRDFDPKADGMVGYSLVPEKAGKHPTVVLWGGSGGNIPHGWANYLASQGFAVVALRYFTYDANDPDVASGAIHHLIDQLPLERFAKAISWAKAQPFCDPFRLSVLGESRGGEAAFLVAQHFGNDLGLHAVIPLRPLDNVVGSKINGADFKGEPEQSSWTVGGEPISFLAKPKGVFQGEEALELARKSGTLGEITWQGKKVPVAALRPGFEAYMPKLPTIDTSEFNGRIVAIGGTADTLWPADVAVRRIAFDRRQFQHADDVFFNVIGAGHYTAPGRRSTNILSEKYMPLVVSSADPNRIFVTPDGGTPEMNAIYDVLNQVAVVRALNGEGVDYLPFNELVERP